MVRMLLPLRSIGSMLGDSPWAGTRGQHRVVIIHGNRGKMGRAILIVTVRPGAVSAVPGLFFHPDRQAKTRLEAWADTTPVPGYAGESPQAYSLLCYTPLTTRGIITD